MENPTAAVIYEFPLPTQVAEIKGITVRYRSKDVIYCKTYDVSIIMCPESDTQRCHAS